ncbi:unnamed protein product [Penicillium roqueforti FM164]|uniref:Genomic scaffold, ProqFM164S02 n=1 Tax=Penicillium roqueforti (strain FM164) TaxID=1365484 RepID=W6Q2G4_PENRF|nr:unnamed protein product [Penicillium roqueforti FM164]
MCIFDSRVAKGVAPSLELAGHDFLRKREMEELLAVEQIPELGCFKPRAVRASKKNDI